MTGEEIYGVATPSHLGAKEADAMLCNLSDSLIGVGLVRGHPDPSATQISNRYLD